MLGIDSEIGASPLHLWVAAGSAALLLVLCVLALFRVAVALRIEVLLLGAVLGAAMMWAFLDRAASVGDLRAERRALEMRANELTAQTLAPGSPLACLDALTGENVEAACEKAIFASPASVATATSYVAARLALFSEVTAYLGRGGTAIDDVLLPLRHALEADRFGFLAHVLAARDGCTGQNCMALARLHDPGRVRAHLSDGTLDQLLERYLTAWAQPPEGPVADATQGRPVATAQPNAQGLHKGMVNIDFPTAASIPAVSIMTAEPSGPVLPGVAAAAAANPNPQPAGPAHRARKQAASPAPPAPVQAGSSSTAATEPIWPEPVPPPPQSASAPAGEGPMRLNPFPQPPAASAGMTVGAQSQ